MCLQCYLSRHPADQAVPERPATRRRHVSRRVIELDRLLGTLSALDLAPVVVSASPPVVRSLCPACGSPDSDGIWRSLLVEGRNGLAWVCANGCRHDNINTAFRALVDERTSNVA